MIVAAAIKYPDGQILRASRHYKVINHMFTTQGLKTKGDAVQGFVDHMDNFLTRAEAKEEALRYKQISPEHKGELYSEDLWPEQPERTD